MIRLAIKSPPGLFTGIYLAPMLFFFTCQYLLCVVSGSKYFSIIHVRSEYSCQMCLHEKGGVRERERERLRERESGVDHSAIV